MTWHRLSRKQNVDPSLTRADPRVSIQRSGDFYLNRHAVDLASSVFGFSIIGQRMVLLVDDFVGVCLLSLAEDGWRVCAQQKSGGASLHAIMKRSGTLIGVGQYRLTVVDVPDNGPTLPAFAWTREGVGWLGENAVASTVKENG